MDFYGVILRFMVAACIGFLGASALAQSPSLAHVVPVPAPGATTEVSFHGSNLAGAGTLWTSFACEISPVATNDEQRAVWRLKLPKDTPVGVHHVRLAGPKGVTSPLLFMVDDLPAALASGTNRSAVVAQSVTLPVAIDGACEPLKSDYYRFKAPKNQRLAVEVVAQRLGSALDPSLRLFDGAGRELAANEDAPGLGDDARLVYRFPAAGEYILEVRDSKFEGGARHRYHLRLGDFPVLNTPYPPGLRAGESVTVSFPGAEAVGVKPANVTAPAGSRGLPLSAAFPKGSGSGFVKLAVSPGAEPVESEPNDSAAQAQKVAVPSTVNGRFASATDRDWFSFEAKKGQRMLFAAKTRSLGSPAELYLRLCKDDGSTIAEANVGGPDESSLTNTFNADGTFKLHVEELTRRGGPEYTYRLEITALDAGFTLSTETEKVEATPGGTFELKVTAVRRSYDGPIKLDVAGLGDGFTLENDTIAEKKTETTLRAKIPGAMTPGQIQMLSVNGTAKIGEREVGVGVSTLPALRKLLPDMRFPPLELDGVVVLGVKAQPK